MLCFLTKHAGGALWSPETLRNCWQGLALPACCPAQGLQLPRGQRLEEVVEAVPLPVPGAPGVAGR